ncbi:RsmD family RNA methyltransferase [Mucispirillum schaedleri]|uniref:RsmD family RNA methyltransferase n=1 Tax=Mucispirillum schaedleri TaxID=248039 RepID=UPI001F58CFCA|nr:RsmD family RNA methyltransferase [Mucispirillum schaedleri]
MRPTTDKLRSAVFSIISDMQCYPEILDAFAGTGALGIEAYSRGALHIDFIDKDISSLKINTALMEKGSYNIYKGDYLKICSTLNKQYDLIMFDPPYNIYKTNEILAAVSSSNLLKEDGIILYEEFYKTEFINHDKFKIIDERRYGDTIIRFLHYNKE